MTGQGPGETRHGHEHSPLLPPPSCCAFQAFHLPTHLLLPSPSTFITFLDIASPSSVKQTHGLANCWHHACKRAKRHCLPPVKRSKHGRLLLLLYGMLRATTTIPTFPTPPARSVLLPSVTDPSSGLPVLSLPHHILNVLFFTVPFIGFGRVDLGLRQRLWHSW